jgi:hypothetical protein
LAGEKNLDKLLRSMSPVLIAAYYHDHIFIQAKFAERAFSILSKYSNKKTNYV